MAARSPHRPDPAPVPREQGVRAGSLYVIAAVGVAGVLTYAYQGMASRALGREGYGALATLWAATFLATQVLWTGVMQTLGRHIAERRARGEGWAAVERSVRHVALGTLGVFLLGALLLGPVLSRTFGGPWLVLAWVLAVAGYGASFYRRGLLSGHRQLRRLSLGYVLEAGGRAALAGVLLAAGLGVGGAAAALVVGPLLSAFLIRVGPAPPPQDDGPPFGIGATLGFAGPVLIGALGAQALANGGPLLISALGGVGAHAQAGLLQAGLILTRAPQYVLSPAISNLLPHLSRLATRGDGREFDRFVRRAGALVAGAGAALVAGAWLLGERALPLLSGPRFRLDRGTLALLALTAALYLMGEFLNQVLWARGRVRLAVLAWLAGVATTGLATWLLGGDLLARVAWALAAGTGVTVLVLLPAYLLDTGSRDPRGATEAAAPLSPVEPH